MRAVGTPVKIDIWSDIVCPYCYLGKHRLEAALADFGHRDEVEVTWHSFELDRHAERVSPVPLVDALAAKYGTSREQAIASQQSIAAAAADQGFEIVLTMNDVSKHLAFTQVARHTAEVPGRNHHAALGGEGCSVEIILAESRDDGRGQIRQIQPHRVRQHKP